MLSESVLPEDELMIAPEWLDWLVENYVEGVATSSLVAPLEQAGVPPALITKALRQVERNTLVRKFREKVVVRDQLLELVKLKAQLELAQLNLSQLNLSQLDLTSEHSRTTVGVGVERRSDVSARDFFENYYTASRPVILCDVAHNWPALELWSRPQYFAEKFADTPLSVCMGRNSDPACDRNFHKHVTTMTMSEYVAWVQTAGETNDGYLISNNRLLENEAFESLLADVVPPEKYVDPSRYRTHMSFWFGPAGTRTPLHHDGNNILFCQVTGRKEFYLVSPWEPELLARAEGYYSHLQVPPGMDGEGSRAPDDAFPWRAHRIVLEPGEALFLPVGWWHQVRALDMSVSLSFLNFHVSNRFEWYSPGKLKNAVV